MSVLLKVKHVVVRNALTNESSSKILNKHMNRHDLMELQQEAQLIWKVLGVKWWINSFPNLFVGLGGGRSMISPEWGKNIL